jgi:hypothetical protein
MVTLYLEYWNSLKLIVKFTKVFKIAYFKSYFLLDFARFHPVTGFYRTRSFWFLATCDFVMVSLNSEYWNSGIHSEFYKSLQKSPILCSKSFFHPVFARFYLVTGFYRRSLWFLATCNFVMDNLNSEYWNSLKFIVKFTKIFKITYFKFFSYGFCRISSGSWILLD